jgi:hypothetical protein
MPDIRRDQVIKIKIAQKELGLDDLTYRLTLNTYFGAKSCKDLTESQADELLKEFGARGWVPKKGKGASRRSPGRRKKEKGSADLWLHANHPLTEMIQRWRVLADVNEAYQYENLCRRIIKREEPRTVGDAQKIVASLKGIVKNKNRKAVSNV